MSLMEALRKASPPMSTINEPKRKVSQAQPQTSSQSPTRPADPPYRIPADIEAEIADLAKLKGAFAPSSDPDRMRQVAGEAGKAIRDAYKATAAQMRRTSEDCKRLAEEIERDMEEFNESLVEIGEAHAQRTEESMKNLVEMLLTFKTQAAALKGVRMPTITSPEELADELGVPRS